MYKPPASLNQGFAANSAADLATLYARGEALANMGRYSEALTCFDQILEVQPDYLKALTFRSVVLIHLGRNQEALETCDRALHVSPQNSEAWTFRGVALYRLSHYRAAYASYDRALGIQRRSPWQGLLHWMKRRLSR